MIPGFHGEALLTPLLKGQGIPLNEAPPSFNMETAFSSSGADHNSHGARMSSPLVCRRCHHFGVDVKLMDCGCYFHAVSFWRRIVLPLSSAPMWNRLTPTLLLSPDDDDDNNSDVLPSLGT